MPLFWTTVFVRASDEGGEPHEVYLHLFLAAADLAAAEALALGNETILCNLLESDRTRIKIITTTILRTVQIPSMDEPAFLVGFADPAAALASDTLDVSSAKRPERL
jgi:hypothetical protein